MNELLSIDKTPDGMLIFSNKEHSLNAKLPILVNELGIEMLFNTEQPEKTLIPIDNRVDGIVIFDKNEQSLNVLSSMEVTDEGIVI